MTTGLLSLYTEIEMPDDEPYNFSGGANTNTKLAWKLDYIDTITLEDALNPQSSNYMVFDDEKPANPGSSFLFGGSGGFTTCQGVGTPAARPPCSSGATTSSSRRLQQPDRRLCAALPAAHRLHAALPVRGQPRPAGSTRRSRT